MKPGISLCMINKNNEKVLPRLFESVKGVVDEICFVDTGSTDSAVAIARSYGARIEEIEWPDAFDVARNVSLEMANHEWILVLDSDEWLPQESGPLIRKAIEEPEVGCFMLRRRDFQGSMEQFSEMQMPRLFLNDPSYRYEGTVHEQVPSAFKGKYADRKVLATDILFFHDSFLEGYSKEKEQFYIRLLKKELELRPGSFYYEVTLANSLYHAGSPETKTWVRRVAAKLLEHKDDPVSFHPEASTGLAVTLASISPIDMSSQRTTTLLDMAKRWFPDDPPVVWLVAELEEARGNHLEALRRFVDIANMAMTQNYRRQGAFDPALFGERLFIRMGRLAQRLGDRELARQTYETLRQLNPESPEAAEFFAKN